MNAKDDAAHERLTGCGLRLSVQRLVIMNYLLEHDTHPTVDDVYKHACGKIKTISRTTVYNTLRLFSEHKAAQMITIDDHRVCYDGCIKPHAHFFCRKCGRITDLMNETVPLMEKPRMVSGNMIDEIQLYYKGVCADCYKQK